MTVASRAVAMAVMTEARAVDVEQEGLTIPRVSVACVCGSDTVMEPEFKCESQIMDMGVDPHYNILCESTLKRYN
jgi:hypothetical protein